jgi:peptidyl-prolyl cis-trans isomerase SurA
MKKFLKFFVTGTILFHSLTVKAGLVTGVAAVVNESVITLGEIYAAVLRPAQIMYKTAGSTERYDQELAKLRDEAFEQQVENKLILHEFVKSGYVTNVLEAMIDDRIQERIQKEDYGDRAKLIQTLKAEGITYEMFRRDQRENFIIEYMTYQNNSSLRKIFISPLKIEQYYQSNMNEFKMEDQVKLRMIVLTNVPGSDPGSAKKRGEEILAKIDSGVSFAEMAQVYSSGSQRAEGGDRGWVDRKYFRPELSDIAFSLKPGQHSGVIEQPETCYLMMVDDVKPAHVKELKDVRGEIEHTIINQERLRLHKLWIDRLKRKSFVRFYELVPPQ